VHQLPFRRLVAAQIAVMVVIALAGTTAIVALRGTTRRVIEARQIDHQLVLLHRLRADARELGLSARRFILIGDLKEKLRIQAIEADMAARRHEVIPLSTLTNADVLDRALDDYIASLDKVLEVSSDDTVQRLQHFETELVRIRAPLAMAFEDVISRERAARGDLRSADRLVTIAQWAVGAACGLGLLLSLGASIALRRRARPIYAAAALAAPRGDPPQDHPSLLH
jgi:hypothetical protein